MYHATTVQDSAVIVRIGKHIAGRPTLFVYAVAWLPGVPAISALVEHHAASAIASKTKYNVRIVIVKRIGTEAATDTVIYPA
jgi:hypothetical protein